MCHTPSLDCSTGTGGQISDCPGQNGTVGNYALTMHPHGSNDSTGYKSWLEQHPATQQKNRRDRESRQYLIYLPSAHGQTFKKAKMLRTFIAMAFLLASAVL